MKIKIILNKINKRSGDNNSRKELISESLIAIVIRCLSAVVSFGMNLVITRSLGLNESGYFFLALSVVTVLATFCRVGSDNVVLRFVSIHKSKNEWNEMQSVIGIFLKKALIISLIVTPIIAFGSHAISVYIFKKPELQTSLVWMGCSIPFFAGYMVLSYGFQGIKKVAHSVTLQGSLLALLLIILVFIFSPNQSSQLAFIYFAVSVINFIVGYIVWKKITKGHLIPYTNKQQLVNESKPLLVVAMFQPIILWGGQFISGAYVSPAALAQLAVAQRTSLLISFILLAIDLVSAPRFAAYYHANEMDKLKKHVTSTTILLIAVSLPMVIIIVIFAPQIMAVFGKGFKGGANILRVLSLGQLVNTITGSVGYLLLMTGHQKEMRNINILTGVIAMILFIILIPIYGAMGAAISTAIAIACQNLLAVRQVKLKLGINTLSFDFVKWENIIKRPL